MYLFIKMGKKIKRYFSCKIEFTSIPQPGEYEAAIKVLGNIKDLSLDTKGQYFACRYYYN